MPRKTKEPTIKEEKKVTKSKVSKSKTGVAKEKKETPKKATTKSTKVSKEPVKKATAKTTAKEKKETPKKTATKSTKVSKEPVKKATAKTTAKEKKETPKVASKTTKKVKTVTKKQESKTKTKSIGVKKASSTKKATTKKVVKKAMDFAPEYYDLPIKYNKTVVKILAQTPTNLFVYWEISDEDREAYKKQYGEYFFEITKPVLTVFNETLNYSFEIDIDDFANSWYLHVNDSNSEYRIELGRRPIPVNYNYMPEYNMEVQGPIPPIEIPYIHISSSNELDTPNDRILFNNKRTVYFRNVKTNQIIKKQIKDFRFAYKNGKFVNLYKLYKELYGNEFFEDSINLNNPSSGNPSSGSFLLKYR